MRLSPPLRLSPPDEAIAPDEVVTPGLPAARYLSAKRDSRRPCGIPPWSLFSRSLPASVAARARSRLQSASRESATRPPATRMLFC